MAEEAGKKAQRKEKRKEARKSGGSKGADKQKNPVLEEARTRYAEQLKKEGVPQDKVKEKMKAHMKDVVKPAMAEAKSGAKSKNLKGPERKKFITESVRSKLGLQA